MRWLAIGAFSFLCSACAVPDAVDALGTHAPPAELGRPGWVRGAAGLGGWIGAIGGAVVSIVVLPVTYPVSLLADEPLGYSDTEFLFAPVSMGASAGHFLLGAPPDAVDFMFRRAWVGNGNETEKGYDYTPSKPPVEPAPRESESR